MSKKHVNSLIKLFLGSRVIFFESGVIQTNLKIVDLLKMIKPFIVHFLDSSALVSIQLKNFFNKSNLLIFS